METLVQLKVILVGRDDNRSAAAAKDLNMEQDGCGEFLPGMDS